MLLLMVLVFVSVFVVIALLLLAREAGPMQRRKQTIAHFESSVVKPADSRNSDLDIRKNETLSSIPWVDRLLQSLEIMPLLRNLLYQAGLSWTAGFLLLTSLGCFALSTWLIFLRSGSLIFALIMGVLVGYTPFLFVLQKRRVRFNHFEQELPEALDLMVSALRAGQSLAAALRLVAYESPDPVGAEFRICFDEQNYGLELRTAMENLVTRVPLQDLRIVITGILIQKESGGNLAEVLDKASYVIRERFRLRQQVRVHTAQGRLTGWILAALPLFLGIALYLVNPKVMSVLWTHAIGIKLLEVCAVMTIVGMLVIRRIVKIEI